MNKIGPAALLLFVSAVSLASAQRPRDPWLFRGSLDNGPACVFLALYREMTVAYDTAGCSLYLAWNGSAEPATGPEPAGSGPTYAAQGPVYHKRSNPSPWSVAGPKGNVPVTVKFVAAEIVDGQGLLTYALALPGGRKITVRERPEFDNHYGDNALFRNFDVTGIPQGFALRLEVGGKGMIETWGGGATGRVEEEKGRWFFIQDSDGATPIKVTWSSK